MKPPTSILFFFIVLTFSATTHAVNVYKWVDEKGVTHYSGQKPSDVEIMPFKPSFRETYGKFPGSNTPSTDNQAAPQEDKKAGDENTKAADQEPEKPRLSAKKRRELCERAKNNRMVIQNKNQIRERDAKGNTRYLTESERQARLTKMRQIEKDNCN